MVHPAASGATNMAVDHALATCLGPREGVLRLYRWANPTASFGRNEPSRELYDRVAARRQGIAFVRRPSGGRVVLHDRELTYALVLPVTRGMSLRAVYRLVNSGLVNALEALQVAASLARVEGRALDPSAGPCFERPAEGEIIAMGRKLVGSAQARLEGAILQHGSLLLGPGQERLAPLRGEPRGGDAPVSLEEILDSLPSWDVLVRTVVDAMRGVLGGEWHEAGLRDAERAASRILESHYGSDAWTWRM